MWLLNKQSISSKLILMNFLMKNTLKMIEKKVDLCKIFYHYITILYDNFNFIF